MDKFKNCTFAVFKENVLMKDCKVVRLISMTPGYYEDVIYVYPNFQVTLY